MGLTWPAVDSNERGLTVNLQLQRVRRELLLRETKTEASDSVLPMPDLCVAALWLRADQQDKNLSEVAEAWRGETRLGSTTNTGRNVQKYGSGWRDSNPRPLRTELRARAVLPPDPEELRVLSSTNGGVVAVLPCCTALGWMTARRRPLVVHADTMVTNHQDRAALAKLMQRLTRRGQPRSSPRSPNISTDLPATVVRQANIR
ncbi:MAG: site-specific integrase [Pseudonocardiales bacterium]|nr:site-specific integrase [Pseudonocardiales bacterium]